MKSCHSESSNTSRRLYPSRTSCGMRMKNMNLLSKNVMHYGHILRQDLRLFDKFKFLKFLSYRLIFLLMPLNFYSSVSVIKELFQFFSNFTFKIIQFLIKIYSCILLQLMQTFKRLSWARKSCAMDTSWGLCRIKNE